jgi:flavin-dependent dehydrogenase
LDVLILDRSEFPRHKTCAGWITPPVLEELGIDAAQYAKENLLQPIHGFGIRRVGDPEARFRSPVPISYGILRREFDDFLLRRCEARLRLGESLESMERRGESWIVNGAIEAKLVVGAGGHSCPVARRLSGIRPADEPIVVAQELEYTLTEEERASCPVQGELPELFFTDDLKGYGWIFRKGDFLNVGLGRQDRHRISEHVERFIRFLRSEGRLTEDPPSVLRGHAYLLYGQAARPLISDAALLVGDAAGLAYPRSGEGIRPAVESGLLAARAIESASGSYDANALAPYPRALERRLGRRDPRWTPGWTDLLPAALTQKLAGRLMAMPWFARRVVIERWFMQKQQGPLPPG